MSRARFQAVLFDFFGTLVDSLSASAHNDAVRAMGGLMGAPDEAFLEQWLSDYDARGSGRWPTVEDCVIHTCEAIGVTPDRRARPRPHASGSSSSGRGSCCARCARHARSDQGARPEDRTHHGLPA